MTGKSFGNYRVGERLGSGRMGVVYRAEDLTLGRIVALKFLSAEVIQLSSSVGRFKDEARAAAAVSHPNICTIYEIGEYDGSPYISMEFLLGQTLKDKIDGRPLPLGTLLDWAIQICDGLASAHSRGIVHRDLKPANLFVTKDGYAKICDFGLAKLQPVPAGHLGSAENTLIDVQTDPGHIVGTPAYMSPEQVQGEQLDPRSDLFSLGAVLYEMATGNLPFSGTTTGTLMAAILRDNPMPPIKLNSRIPPELNRILGKALEKDKNLRYQSATDLAADLRRLRRDSDSVLLSNRPATHGAEAWQGSRRLFPVLAKHRLAARLVSRETAGNGAGSFWSRSRSSLIIVASVVLVAACALALYFLLSSPRTTYFEHPGVTKITSTGLVTASAISPDGKYVAYSTGTDRQSLHLRQLITGTDVEIAPTSVTNYVGITFSPDASYIYYVREVTTGFNDLFEVSTLGGNPHRLLHDIDSAIAFSPNAKHIAFIRGNVRPEEDGLLVANADGREEHTVLTRKGSQRFLWPFATASWSPDGKLLAFPVRSSGPHDQLSAASVDGREVRSLGPNNWIFMGPVNWVQNGRGLIVSATSPFWNMSQIWEISYPDGKVRAIRKDAAFYLAVSITKDAEALAAIRGTITSHLWVVDDISTSPSTTTLGNLRQITTGSTEMAGYFGLKWLSASALVYVTSGYHGDDIASIEVSGANAKEITSGDHTWSGFLRCGDQHLVFASHRDNSSDLWRIDLDGSNKQFLAHNAMLTSCSSDGQWVRFSPVENLKETRQISLNGGNAKVVRYEPVDDELSPDGTRIAYPARQGNPAITIALVNEPLKPIKNLAVAMRPWHWDARGRNIDFVKTSNGADNIWRQPLDGSSPKQLTHLDSDRIFDFAWSHDGKHLALARGVTSSDVVLISDSASGQ